MSASESGMAVVTARVVSIFTTNLGLPAPAIDADLFDTGVLDSVTFVDLLLHLEREFGIKCPLEELELDNFRSIGRIVNFIQSAAAAQGCAA